MANTSIHIFHLNFFHLWCYYRAALTGHSFIMQNVDIPSIEKYLKKSVFDWRTSTCGTRSNELRINIANSNLAVVDDKNKMMGGSVRRNIVAFGMQSIYISIWRITFFSLAATIPKQWTGEWLTEATKSCFNIFAILLCSCSSPPKVGNRHSFLVGELHENFQEKYVIQGHHYTRLLSETRSAMMMKICACFCSACNVASSHLTYIVYLKS